MHMQNFTTFCQERNIRIHDDIRPSTANTQGRCIVATKNIPRNTHLIRVPKNAALFGFQQIFTQSDSDFIPRHLMGELSAAEGLALNLALHACHPSQPIQPWLNTWPGGEQGSMMLTDDERRALSWCEELTSLHTKREEAIISAHERIRSAMATTPERIPPLDCYRWALSHVGARAMDVMINGSAEPAIVPFVDLCNHTAEPNAAVRFEANEFVLTAIRTVESGEQLCISYGDKSNAELIFGYGFAMAVNPSDTLILRVPPAPTDDPQLNMQRFAMAPRGSMEADGTALLAPLYWNRDHWNASDHGERRRVVLLQPELLFVLNLASARSVPDLFRAAAISDADKLERPAWEILQLAVREAMKALPSQKFMPSDTARAALQARCALLEGTASLASSKINELSSGANDNFS